MKSEELKVKGLTQNESLSKPRSKDRTSSKTKSVHSTEQLHQLKYIPQDQLHNSVSAVSATSQQCFQQEAVIKSEPASQSMETTASYQVSQRGSSFSQETDFASNTIQQYEEGYNDEYHEYSGEYEDVDGAMNKHVEDEKGKTSPN